MGDWSPGRIEPAYLKFDVVFGLINTSDSRDDDDDDDEDPAPNPLDLLELILGRCFFFLFINSTDDGDEPTVMCR